MIQIIKPCVSLQFLYNNILWLRIIKEGVSMRIKLIQDIIDLCRGRYFKKIDWKNKKNYKKNLEKAFRLFYGYSIDWNNVKTLGEKIYWLRLNDNDPIKTVLADKYACREYVKKAVGEEYLIPLLGVYDDHRGGGQTLSWQT